MAGTSESALHMTNLLEQRHSKINFNMSHFKTFTMLPLTWKSLEIAYEHESKAMLLRPPEFIG